MAIPKKHAACVPWMVNFSARLSADPAKWASTAPAALAVAEAVEAYRAIYESLMQQRADGTWSRSLTAGRNAARQRACDLIRPIYLAVQASRAISDEEKIALGVYVSAGRSAAGGAPAGVPTLTLKAVVNRTATVSIRDLGSEHSRRRPAGCAGANVFWCTGDAPAPAGTGWHFAGNATRSTMQVALNDVPATAATVWVCAMWFGRRGQTGESSRPLRIDLPAIQQSPIAPPLRAAA